MKPLVREIALINHQQNRIESRMISVLGAGFLLFIRVIHQIRKKNPSLLLGYDFLLGEAQLSDVNR